LSSDSPLQGDLRGTLMEVTKTAEQLRELVDYLERHPESLIRGKRRSEEKK
jgi:paraquat-inducible protein B